MDHLRKKLEADPVNPIYSHNERGVGYRFDRLDNFMPFNGTVEMVQTDL